MTEDEFYSRFAECYQNMVAKFPNPEAGEVLQDLFLHLLGNDKEGQQRFKRISPEKFEAFLAVCVKRRLVDRIRKSNRTASLEFEVAAQEGKDPSEQDSVVGLCQRAIQWLTPQQQQALSAWLKHGSDRRQAAKHLGWPVTTYDRCSHQARARLKNLLEQADCDLAVVDASLIIDALAGLLEADSDGEPTNSESSRQEELEERYQLFDEAPEISSQETVVETSFAQPDCPQPDCPLPDCSQPDCSLPALTQQVFTQPAFTEAARNNCLQTLLDKYNLQGHLLRWSGLDLDEDASVLVSASLRKFLLQKAQQHAWPMHSFRQLATGWWAEFVGLHGLPIIRTLTVHDWPELIERCALEKSLLEAEDNEPAWAEQFRRQALSQPVLTIAALRDLAPPEAVGNVPAFTYFRRDLISQIQKNRKAPEWTLLGANGTCSDES